MSKRRIIDGWNDLAWEELIAITSIPESVQHYTRKQQAWLMLNKLGTDERDKIAFNRKGELLVTLYKKGWGKERLHITRNQLAWMVNKDMAFMDCPTGDEEHGGLTVLPRETIRIGRKLFRLPEPLIANITYQQYSNTIKLINLVDGMTENMDLRNPQKNLDDFKSKAKELKMAMARVVSHLLVPRSLRLTREDGGRKRIGIGWEWAYSPEVAEENTRYIARHAPVWIYPILCQHLMSCIQIYKREYPDMFSNDGGEEDKMPFIAEADTINAVMKWQSYTNQQEVYDTNAVFIFSILCSMSKEAKELERINSRAKMN